MLITEEYLALNADKHLTSDAYGSGGCNFSDMVFGMTETFQTQDVLDYGCGKATLQQHLGFPIQNYDPCIPKFAKPPEPAELLVCTDVLEHIEPECLEDTLDHMASLCKRAFLMTIAVRSSVKTLADGTPTHRIVERADWWYPVLSTRFFVMSYDLADGLAIARGLAKCHEDEMYGSWEALIEQERQKVAEQEKQAA